MTSKLLWFFTSVFFVPELRFSRVRANNSRGVKMLVFDFAYLSLSPSVADFSVKLLIPVSLLVPCNTEFWHQDTANVNTHV